MALPVALAVGVGTYLINLKAARDKYEISEQEYRQAVEAANKFEREMKALRPDETWENIDPKLLSKAAKYSPEIAAFVEENAPQLIQEPESATEKRVQREALQKLATQAETGRDVISEAQREQALYEVGARAKGRQEQLAEALRRKGQLGTGQARSLQFEAEQAEALTARQDALRGVQEAEMRRRQALGQAASLAGQIRGQNLQVESANVGTMNAYNQRLANARNLYNQYTAGERNRAQMINQQRQRETEQYNLGLQNQYAMFNRQQQEAAKERARQFDVGLKDRLYGIKQGAESGRFQAQRQLLGDEATALTSAAGAGLSTYGGLKSLQLKEDAINKLGSGRGGSGSGSGRGGSGSSATRSIFSLAQAPQFMEDREQEDLVQIGYAEPEAFGPIRPRKPWTEEEI